MAFDFAGKEIWRKPLPLPPTQYGTASSPIVYDDKVLVQRDGNDGKSELLAVDGKSGATVWQTTRQFQRESWSTPTIWSHDGQDELLVVGNGRLVAYSPNDGTEHWWVGGLSLAPITMAVSGDGLIFASTKSFAGAPGDRLELPTWDALLQYDQNKDGKLAEDEIPADLSIHLRKDVPKETPGNLLPMRGILARVDFNKDKALSKSEWEGMLSFMEKNSDVVVAVRPGGKGDCTKSHVAWTASRGIAEMPSPLFYQGRLYIVRDGGMVTSYEPATGKVIMDRQRLGVLGQYVASPVAADGRIYAASETGTVVVFRAGDSLEVLARNELGEGIRATPAITANKLYVRTLDHLWAFGN
jgi:outer membrane protein assembly factor BamB